MSLKCWFLLADTTDAAFYERTFFIPSLLHMKKKASSFFFWAFMAVGKPRRVSAANAATVCVVM